MKLNYHTSLVPGLLVLPLVAQLAHVVKGDLLGNILTCSPSARYVLHECYAQYERERDEFGGTYCCIYGKYVSCLKEKMDIWCRRSIQQLVDATVGKPLPYNARDPKGCQGIYYPSAYCAVFFNSRLILAIGSLVAIALTLACVVCCCHCCLRRCGRKVKGPE
ncbi:hypothetical protein HDE_00677 [Halotydeus destructor]|nr:hypothetical protein HDE_00677 [Halotydeus destructor]